jgi:hypothetical protein
MNSERTPEQGLNQTEIDALLLSFGCLAERWADEGDYEDFADYQQFASERLLPARASLLKMTKRPFAITFKCGEKTYTAKATSREVTLTSEGAQ